MAEQTKVKTLEKVVIRFSGDSGDGRNNRWKENAFLNTSVLMQKTEV